MRSSLRARLLTAFLLVAVPPVLLLAGAASALLTRSFQQGARQRLDAALGSARARLAAMRREAAEQLAAIAREDLANPSASRADDRSLATSIARRRGLEAFEIVDSSGRVVSSHHWPVGFGLVGRDEAFAGDAAFRLVTAAEGLGAAQRLALMPAHSARWRGSPVILRGGVWIDAAFLADLGQLMGLQAAFFDAEHARWIAPPGSPLASWKPSGFAGAATRGEVTLDDEATLRWSTARLADQLWLVVAASRSDERALTQRVQRLTLLAGAGALAAALAAAALLSRAIARPIRELADGVRRLAAGSAPAPVAVTTRDEIASLAEAFNALSRDLELSRARLIQAERVAAWREMARRLAHELKNPLFPIQLSIETLRRAAETSVAPGQRPFSELFHESSDTILEALRSLRKIVDEFSQFARLPRPRFAPTDLNEVAEQVLGLYAARAGGVRIERRLQPGLPRVPADRELVARALGNLVANALDAMPEAGTLSVRSGAAAGEARLEVADSGPGLDAEQRERLFTPYFTTRPGGTGLGLAIVQGIAADHGGRVEVASEPGHGAVFSLVLPVARTEQQS